MTFTHDRIAASLSAIVAALEMLENGTLEFFCMGYGEYEFIQVEYDKQEGFTVEVQYGKKSSELVTTHVENKDDVIRLIKETPTHCVQSPPKTPRRLMNSPFTKIITSHVLVSCLPVVVYGVLLAHIGHKSLQNNLLVSLFCLMGFLFIYNGLFVAMRQGSFFHRGGSVTLAKYPAAFFVETMFGALFAFAVFGFGIYSLNH